MDISIQSFQNKQKIRHKNKKFQQSAPKFGQNITTQRPASLALVDTNHNKAFVKRSNLSFKGDIPAPALNHVLERRVSSALQAFGKDDIILVGKDIKEAKSLLKKSVGSIKGAIKKVFFIADEKMNGALAIHENDKGFKAVINLNKEHLTLNSQGRQFFTKTGESIVIFNENDEVWADNFRFGLKETKVNLDEVRKSSVKEFDFSKKDEAAISNLNSRNIDQLAPEAAEENADGSRKIRFADIGGQDEAISKIKKSILYPIKYPNAYKNQILNRGIILEGPPGTGKTLLAEALANEADAHFIGINGLEMESKWVGESDENWRKLFKEAKQKSPTILFIDEFDAVARKRGSSSNGSNHDDKVVNQLLTLMSDVEKGKYGNTFVIVTTNKTDLLDEAITRSGRFGEKITMKAPSTVKDARNIFDIHSKKKPLSESLDKDAFAEKLLSAKATGADISHIVNEAHKNAFERLGINEKMENETLVDADLDNVKIEAEDLHKSLDEFKAQNKNQTDPRAGRVLGFHKPTPPKKDE